MTAQWEPNRDVRKVRTQRAWLVEIDGQTTVRSEPEVLAMLAHPSLGATTSKMVRLVRGEAQ